MSNVKLFDKEIRLIKKSEYVNELEDQVKFRMETTPDLPVNDILYERVVEPIFDSENKKLEWQLEEINRCKNGHNGLTGKMYFYFNFGWIQNPEFGKIPPEFRVCDSAWFDLITECQASREWGVVCVKRRRVGASWKESADVLHDTLFTPFFQVGMNSKSEKDSIELFKKVKFMYDNLPDFMRVRTSAGNTKMSLDFSYYARDSKGNKIKRGTQSAVSVTAPTVSAFEGRMLNKWVCDEAGKIPQLPQMWSFTEDTLMQETTRIGIPLIFGTSGEVSGAGGGLREMWYNSDVYRLRRFFFAGWMGLVVDEYGNDRKEDAIRWILYERKRREKLGQKAYNDHMQKYPLDVQEAFVDNKEGGIGNLININQQKQSLIENPVAARRGRFVLGSNQNIVFKTDPFAPGIIYESPIDDQAYVSGCDPTDHDDTLDVASDLSMYIMAKPRGTKPPRIVFEYTDKPDKAADYYEQALLALMYYNKTAILIENNRYRMISHFEERGYAYLLQRTPQTVMRLIPSAKINSFGVKMTKAMKEYLCSLIDEYTEENCEYIPSLELLEEFKVFGAENTDRAMAFGITLIQLKETRRINRSPEQKKAYTPTGYKFGPSGRIVRSK